jgi:cobalt-precorrin 5A hydrolase
MIPRIIAIGVGCRLHCPATLIETLVQEALKHVVVKGHRVIFTIEGKVSELGLIEASANLKLDLVALPTEVLKRQSSQISYRSVKTMELLGVPSVAEAAALAGAGYRATLIVPRTANHKATCAIAMSYI